MSYYQKKPTCKWEARVAPWWVTWSSRL